MFGYLSPEMAYGLLIACVVICFFVGHAMDGVMGSIGFGVFGNMTILGTGLALGLFLAELVGLPLGRMEVVVGSALVGAFGSLLVLAVFKHLFLRT
ncbi:hypothetical protein [Hoeflea sp. TYP-13]|uniref:hypothetical protein n=1 Tax=Hoeflea sp. TYP-13 TaxID=3230023 RepID=UPI0034C6000B